MHVVIISVMSIDVLKKTNDKFMFTYNFNVRLLHNGVAVNGQKDGSLWA